MNESPKEVELSRDLGLFTITMIGVGAMVGAGIFLLAPIAAGAAGPALIVAFLLNGIITLTTAFSYAELGSAMPKAGGSYVWVKEALPSAGFLCGWMDWFAHAVVGSVYCLGFGSYFGELLTVMGISFFGLKGIALQKFLAVGIGLIFIAINFKGVSETGLAGNIITVVQNSLLGLFVLSGLYTMYRHPGWTVKFHPFMPDGFHGILIAMGLTFIAFEGYEIIVQAGEEVKNPKKNLPRATFLSILLVLPLYVLVAFVAIGATNSGAIPTWQFLGNHGELGLLEAARQFMPYGTFLMVFAGLVATTSALNATTFSSTRVFFAMGRAYNLPSVLAKIHPKNKTPYISCFFSGGLIIIMALALPLTDVASAADIMFLLLFLQVNATAIALRKRGGLDYGYKMPFFPYIPILGILSLFFLALYLFNYSPVAWYVTLMWIGGGLIIYKVYSKSKEEIETEKIARETSPEEYRIVVPVTIQETVKPLMTIASGLAKAQKSDVVALTVVEMPYQTFLQSGKRFIDEKSPILDLAASEGKKLGIEVKKKVYISHDASKAIIDFAHSGSSDIIVMGWTGKIYSARARRSVPQKVMNSARCNVCVVKAKGLGKVKKILLPVGMGDHVYRVKMADRLAKNFGASIDIISIVDPKADEKILDKIKEIHSNDKALVTLKKVKSEVVRSKSPEKVLISRSKDYDLILIGPSKEWILHDVLFGPVPNKIANESKCTVLMMKQPEQEVESWAGLMCARAKEKWFKW